MYAQGHITCEEEAKLPFFNSHEEARRGFKEKYRDSLLLNFRRVKLANKP
jgi:hypothetical protein